MRTALEMLDRMEALTRKLAAANTWSDGGYDMRDEAAAIVAELPDPLIEQAREAVIAWMADSGRVHLDIEAVRKGSYDDNAAIGLALSVLRTGRAAK